MTGWQQTIFSHKPIMLRRVYIIYIDTLIASCASGNVGYLLLLFWRQIFPTLRWRGSFDPVELHRVVRQMLLDPSFRDLGIS